MRSVAALSRSDAAIAQSERAKIAVIEHSRCDKMASIDHHKIRSATAPAGERAQFWSTNIDRTDPLGWEQVEHRQGFLKAPGCPKHLEKSYAKTA